MARVVESTVDVRFSAAGEARADVASNVDGDVARQAELVCLAHHAARTVNVVGRDRGLALVQSLLLLDEAAAGDPGDEARRLGIRIVPDADVDRAAAVHVVARFLGGRRQPRVYFRMKSRASAGAPLATKADLTAASLYVGFDALLRRAVSHDDRRRAFRTAQFAARLVADGVLRTDNELDVALAAADVAWHSETAFDPDAPDDRTDGVRCPVCGNDSTRDGFELRLWPSEQDAIRRCVGCESGLWLHRGQPARPMAAAVWEAMESLRERLAADAVSSTRPDEAPTLVVSDRMSSVLADLKRVFLENRWPFAEVRDAAVLVSDLSGVWGTWKFYAQVVDEHDVVLFYSICPLRVPEDVRLEAASFLTRANYGLASGNFELDFEDGEIRYKTAVHVDGALSPAAVRRAVRANGIAMETYLPGIGAVIAGTAAQPALDRRVDV
jgi:hypothetical protein